jgi:hypothetical protein
VTFLIPVGAILLGAAASAGNCSSGI